MLWYDGEIARSVHIYYVNNEVMTDRGFTKVESKGECGKNSTTQLSDPATMSPLPGPESRLQGCVCHQSPEVAGWQMMNSASSGTRLIRH
jgi:hypothetical protein